MHTHIFHLTLRWMHNKNFKFLLLGIHIFTGHTGAIFSHRSEYYELGRG